MLKDCSADMAVPWSLIATRRALIPVMTSVP
jgi:hypothetical protein